MKTAVRSNSGRLLERAYMYKLLSYLMQPLLVKEELAKLKTSINATFPDRSPRKLSNFLRLVEQSCSSETRSELAGFMGEMRELEPLERKLVASDSVGTTLADLRGFYSAFELDLTGHYLPDHFSVEAEFMAHLLLREAYAIATGNLEMREVVLDAEKKFLGYHLGRLLAYLNLYQMKLPMLRDVSKLGAAFLMSELKLYAVNAPTEALRVNNDLENSPCPLA